jgi:RimJ/RimL family protein N-acetyltransferase
MIVGNKIILRGLELSDVDELMKHWNKQEVKQYLLQIAPHSREEEEEWIRSTWKNRKEGSSYVFAIVTKAEGLHIGNVEVMIKNQISRRGEVGIVIFNSTYWGQGLGSEALELILDYGFKNLNLYSIELKVFEKNQRARAAYKKVGFVEVGRQREAHFFEGQLIDIIIMDILASEWRTRKRR